MPTLLTLQERTPPAAGHSLPRRRSHLEVIPVNGRSRTIHNHARLTEAGAGSGSLMVHTEAAACTCPTWPFSGFCTARASGCCCVGFGLQAGREPRSKPTGD